MILSMAVQADFGLHFELIEHDVIAGAIAAFGQEKIRVGDPTCSRHFTEHLDGVAVDAIELAQWLVVDGMLSVDGC